MDQRGGGLVRRRHPHGGIHVATAVWYRSGKPPVLIRWVLIRDPQGAFGPQALLSEDPAQILQWFVLRWQLEVTPYQVRGRLFQEVRTHLGVETQRQWSDLAIARTTPALLGLFSWTTLAAHALQKGCPISQRKAAWYDKLPPTFVDAIALVRRRLWLASEGLRRRPRYATPHHSVPPTYRFPCLCRLKCAKSRQGSGQPGAAPLPRLGRRVPPACFGPLFGTVLPRCGGRPLLATGAFQLRYARGQRSCSRVRQQLGTG